MNINVYAEQALKAMQTKDASSEGSSGVRSVFVVVHHPHTRTLGTDACPGENLEDVFEELAWELTMADLRRFA